MDLRPPVRPVPVLPPRTPRVRHVRTSAALVLALLCVGCGGDATDAPSARAPHDVVLIVIDTLRADRLGCYGYDRATSPALDGLAASGVRFAHCTSQSSWTAPSMVSLMQSRHLAADFVRMPAGETLAERLASAGFRCVAFQDNILLAPGTGFDRGFARYEMEAGPKKIEPALARDAADPRPLFAYFHFVDPHDPYDPLPRFDVFEPREVDDAQRARLGTALRQARPDLTDDSVAARVLAAARAMNAARARYDGDVLQADGRVRYVLDALASAGRDDAYVIVAADHGECLWDQREAVSQLPDDARDDLLRVFKQTHNTVLYGALVHTPLLLAGPGLPRGLVVDAPVQNVDIVPTLLDLLGLPGADACDGTSLLPALRAAADGARPPAPRPAWSNTKLFTAVAAPDGKKLVLPWDAAGPDAPQLFDLAADPDERTPLTLAGEDYERLRQAIDAHRRAALAPSAGEDVLDKQVAERMRQLGYLGGEEGDGAR
ncbi:MAG: sulfatase [Planctomycetes bacterium]|nr:sulfatase [Planctomycetota bacterium]